MPNKDRKKKGWTLPGYNYCGPFNSLDAGPPTSKLDEACQQHDQGYDSLGAKAYFLHNEADEKLLSAARKESGISAGLVSSYFGAKKKLMPKVGKNWAKIRKINTARKRKGKKGEDIPTIEHVQSEPIEDEDDDINQWLNDPDNQDFINTMMQNGAVSSTGLSQDMFELGHGRKRPASDTAGEPATKLAKSGEVLPSPTDPALGPTVIVKPWFDSSASIRRLRVNRRGCMYFYTKLTGDPSGTFRPWHKFCEDITKTVGGVARTGTWADDGTMLPGNPGKTIMASSVICRQTALGGALGNPHSTGWRFYNELGEMSTTNQILTTPTPMTNYVSLMATYQNLYKEWRITDAILKIFPLAANEKSGSNVRILPKAWLDVHWYDDFINVKHFDVGWLHANIPYNKQEMYIDQTSRRGTRYQLGDEIIEIPLEFMSNHTMNISANNPVAASTGNIVLEKGMGNSTPWMLCSHPNLPLTKVMITQLSCYHESVQKDLNDTAYTQETPGYKDKTSNYLQFPHQIEFSIEFRGNRAY